MPLGEAVSNFAMGLQITHVMLVTNSITTRVRLGGGEHTTPDLDCAFEPALPLGLDLDT